MKQSMVGLLLIGAGFLTTSAMAAGDVAAGKEVAATCVACHGEGGKGGMPGFPVLAGQHADYLAQALVKYQNGERQNPMMAGMAAGLSEQDIHDVAAYFASQKGLQVLKR